jgi:hypothetical protein
VLINRVELRRYGYDAANPKSTWHQCPHFSLGHFYVFNLACDFEYPVNEYFNAILCYINANYLYQPGNRKDAGPSEYRFKVSQSFGFSFVGSGAVR